MINNTTKNLFYRVFYKFFCLSKILFSILFFCFLVACATTTHQGISKPLPKTHAGATQQQDVQQLFRQKHFRFHTSEWFLGSDPINAKVHVKRVHPQVVTVHFDFVEPLVPSIKKNLSLYHYFLFCFASIHSAGTGHSKWVLGADPKQKNTQEEMTVSFAAVNNDSDLNKLKNLPIGGKKIQWEQRLSTTKGGLQLCRKIVKPPYWKPLLNN